MSVYHQWSDALGDQINSYLLAVDNSDVIISDSCFAEGEDLVGKYLFEKNSISMLENHKTYIQSHMKGLV